MISIEASIRDVIAFLYSVIPGQGSGTYLDGDYGSQTAYDEAAEENLLVVVPESNQLQIDIDNNFQFAVFAKNLPKVEHFYGRFDVEENPSRSGLPKRHITLTARRSGVKFEAKERLILQMFLGSDPTREFLGLQRVRVSDPVPTLFLEAKPAPPVQYEDDIPF